MSGSDAAQNGRGTALFASTARKGIARRLPGMSGVPGNGRFWPLAETRAATASGPGPSPFPRVNLSQSELWTAIRRGLCAGGKSLHECQY